MSRHAYRNGAHLARTPAALAMRANENSDTIWVQVDAVVEHYTSQRVVTNSLLVSVDGLCGCHAL